MGAFLPFAVAYIAVPVYFDFSNRVISGEKILRSGGEMKWEVFLATMRLCTVYENSVAMALFKLLKLISME